MPRRIIDYPGALLGWNYVSSMGAFMTGLSSLFFIGMLIWTLDAKVAALATITGAKVRPRWSGLLSSPPPFHTFEELAASSRKSRRTKRLLLPFEA